MPEACLFLKLSTIFEKNFWLWFVSLPSAVCSRSDSDKYTRIHMKLKNVIEVNYGMLAIGNGECNIYSSFTVILNCIFFILWTMGKYRMYCILTIIHYYKPNEIDMNFRVALKHPFPKIWYAEDLSFIHKVRQDNSIV